MFERIDSYIYTGLSFFTFDLDQISLLCLRYLLSRFFKNKYLTQIKHALKDNSLNCIKPEMLNYYIYSILESAKNASLFIINNKKELKILKKYLSREPNFCNYFKIIDLSDEIKLKKVTFIFNFEQEYNKHKFLTYYFNDYQIINLEILIKQLKSETLYETIFDLIKLKLLQDDQTEVYFIKNGIYANIIANYIYELNRVAIII